MFSNHLQREYYKWGTIFECIWCCFYFHSACHSSPALPDLARSFWVISLWKRYRLFSLWLHAPVALGSEATASNKDFRLRTIKWKYNGTDESQISSVSCGRRTIKLLANLTQLKLIHIFFLWRSPQVFALNGRYFIALDLMLWNQFLKVIFLELCFLQSNTIVILLSRRYNIS